MSIITPSPYRTVFSYGNGVVTTCADEDDTVKEATAVITSYLYGECLISLVTGTATELTLIIASPRVEITYIGNRENVVTAGYDFRNLGVCIFF